MLCKLKERLEEQREELVGHFRLILTQFVPYVDTFTVFPSSDVPHLDDARLFYSPDIFKTYPFLHDDLSVSFIKTSKIMFINRGLPGSGKSTLTGKIVERYGEDKTQICSADHFHIDAQGVYRFRIENLAAAHEACQLKTRNACFEKHSPVVVDNTNLKLWEVKKYLEIAETHGYIPILIEPRTRFKFDPYILFTTNKHDVPLESLIEKCKAYQTFMPTYFGWSLNALDTQMLCKMAESVYCQVVKVFPQFTENLENEKGVTPNDLFDFNGSLKEHAHCTARFCGRNRHSEENEAYVRNPNVALSISKVFNLEIIGFASTEGTISAQVKFNDEQCGLWDNNMSEEEQALVLNAPYVSPKERQYIEELGLMRELATSSARAHITLHLAKGQAAVQAGYDLVTLLLKQLVYQRIAEDQRRTDIQIKDTFDYQLWYLGDSSCFIRLRNPFTLKAMFNSFY